MKRVLVALLFLLVAPSFSYGWTDSTLYTANLSSSLDSTKIHVLISRCVIRHLFDNGYTSTCFRLDNHILQYDDTADIYYNGPGNTGAMHSTIQGLTLFPCLFFTGTNISDTGDLFVFFRGRLYLDNAGNNSELLGAYIFHDVNLSTDSIADIENYNFYLVQRPEDWPFPLLIKTTPSVCSFSTYLTKNVPSQYNGSYSVYMDSTAQSNGAYLQMSNHWSLSWLRTLGLSSGLNNAGQYLMSYLLSNRVVYLQSNFTGPCWGSPQATAGAAGYVAYTPALFNVQNDFDRGGQLDWSEYYSGSKDMKVASDDNPNESQLDFDSAGVASMTPDRVPGQDNFEEIFGAEAVPEDANSFESKMERVKAEYQAELEQNAGYNLLTTLINPNGFSVNSPLPSFSFTPQGVNLNSNTRSASSLFSWGTFTIDFNVLRQEPIWTYWQILRQLMVLYLFVETFLVGYGMYEKALAWSAS